MGPSWREVSGHAPLRPSASTSVAAQLVARWGDLTVKFGQKVGQQAGRTARAALNVGHDMGMAERGHDMSQSRLIEVHAVLIWLLR